MAIMYFFNVLMGKVGSFLMLIFMVLQLAGSAGTYPVEISGSMVAAIHKFVPFTYSVDAFRSTISGGEPVYHEMFVLLMIGLIFTGLTILVFWHRGKRIKANKPTLYDWIEVHGLA
jgi:putative membrane protein